MRLLYLAVVLTVLVRFAQKVLNPTHGGGWIGSVPFYRHIFNRPLIPPMAMGGYFNRTRNQET